MNTLINTLGMGNAVLCYVERPWAFFTTQKLSEQWGDDWDDAPYEHNAGRPYEFHPRDVVEWKIIQVAYDALLDTPAARSLSINSQYSVKDINAGCTPWLSNKYLSNPIAIHAGTTLNDFVKIIESIGGKVYIDHGLVK